MGASIATGSMLTPRTPFLRLLAATSLFIFLVLYTFRPSSTRFPTPVLRHAPIKYIEKPLSEPTPVQQLDQYVDCSLNSTNFQYLKEKYYLGDEISYGRRFIRYQRQDIERKSLTKLDDFLFPDGFDLVELKNPPKKSQCLPPLEVPVPSSPFPSSVDASDLLFGVSTTFKRFKDPIIAPVKEWAHWLTNGNGKSNGAGLVLRLTDANPQEIEETTQKIKSFGIDVQVVASDSSIEMAERYLSLLPALYNDTSRVSRKWLIVCDDDTFFPAMHALVKRLETYDHNMDLYIGTLSEDVMNVHRHGSQAFGGAGVIFSLPLAKKIASKFDECSTPEKLMEANTGWGAQGDVLLRKCIYEHTDVRLSLLRDLHQMDIMNDPSGFYESGVAPLSLHHFKGGIWHKARPYEGAHIMHACGEACYLQRFRSKDNFILSNGYSVAYYPKGINFNLDQMERTFSCAPDDYGWNLDFMLGPGRINLSWTGRKASWELMESARLPDGALKQTYIRKANDGRWALGYGGEGMFDIDGVMELVWIP